MTFSLLPEMVTDAVTDLSPKFLRKNGIRLLMMDFDNTLMPYTINTPTNAVEDWLRAMIQDGFPICVVSNSRRPRVREFCEKYGIACFTDARKPFSCGIRQCLEHYGLKPEECALVGDQIFTDTLGANCSGVRSILVNAIHNHNFVLRLRHVAEKPFIFAARKRRISR